jgi:hypothetical protein
MKNKMSKSKVANRVTGLQEFLDSLSKPKMQNGGLKPVDSAKNPGLAKLPTKVRNKMGYMEKGGMNIKKETMENATPSIPNSYYKMGGKKEMNPLSSMLPKKSMKPKMGMGGNFNKGVPAPIATEGKDFMKKQSFKKGGMTKKKK